MTAPGASGLAGAAGLYHGLAEKLQRLTREPPELLHVNAGLIVWLLGIIVFRLPPRAILALAPVFAAACANEVLDALFWTHIEASAPIDILNTCAWPAILCLFANLRGAGKR